MTVCLRMFWTLLATVSTRETILLPSLPEALIRCCPNWWFPCVSLSQVVLFSKMADSVYYITVCLLPRLVPSESMLNWRMSWWMNEWMCPLSSSCVSPWLFTCLLKIIFPVTDFYQSIRKYYKPLWRALVTQDDILNHDYLFCSL